MAKELNVLYQFDDNYAPFAGISIFSLLENNKNIEDIHVYCAILNVSNRNIELLNRTAEKYGRNIIYLDTKKVLSQIESIGAKSWNGSLATWIKIFIIEELIGKIDQLLYIDSDTLIEGSLKDLCGFDFEEKPMACVIDSLSFVHLRRLNIEKNKYYFNAGLMFFNLKYFAEHEGFYNKMIKHLEENIERYLVNDQDLLNDFFCTRIKKMSPKYNFQGIHYMYSDDVYFKVYGRYEYYSLQEIASARADVRIIHFFRVLGDYPWVEGNYHPLKEEFEKWKSVSLWGDMPSVRKERSMIFKVERLLYRFLPRVIFLKLFKYITERGY